MKIKKKSGITMVEMLISTALIAAVSLISMQMFNSMNDIYETKTAESWMLQADQKGLNVISRDISSSRTFIGRKFDNVANTTEASNAAASYSRYFLNKIDLSLPLNIHGLKYQATNITNRVLPVIYDATTLTSINTYPERVGNSLMLGSFEDSVTVTFNSTLPVVTARKISIDLLSLQYYYLAKFDNRLHLVKWSSQYFAEYTQIKNLLDGMSGDTTGQNNLLTQLKGLGLPLKSSYNGKSISIAKVWKIDNKSDDMNDAVSPRFYELTQTAGSLDAITDTAYKIPLRQAVLVTNSFGSRTYSIAKNNCCLPSPVSSPNDNIRVPKFATSDGSFDSLEGFPNGFEVISSGQSGARGIFTRLLSESRISRSNNKKVYNQTTILSVGRDS